MRNILILQGHPDAVPHYGHALAQAYREAARHAGHEVREIDVAGLEFPLLRSKHDFESGDPPDPIRSAQEAIEWASHIVIFYPLWPGSMPALLKGFQEQVFRPGFALPEGENRTPWKKRLGGRSAHIVITMGMPAFFYRWYFRARSLKGLERNILAFCGIKTVRESLIGRVESTDGAARQKWLYRMAHFGMAAK